MPYGIIKVDQVTFTNAGVDQTISVSGIVASISGNITATGTISGNVIRGGTTVSGATVTGTAGQFGTITGNTAGFTTVTGTTVTGTTATFTSGVFTNISGGTHTITSGVFASGTAANPSITFQDDVNTGIYSPGADQVAISTNGTGRLFVDASGNIALSGAGTGTRYLGLLSEDSSYTGSYTLQAGGGSAGFGGGIVMYGHSHASYPGSVWIGRSSGATGPIMFGAGGIGPGSEQMRITSAGLVGVGTSSPSARLDVEASNFAGGPAIGARYNTSNVRLGFNVANSNGFTYIGSNTNNKLSSDTATYDLTGQPASQLRLDGGQLIFNNAPIGTAGNDITFTNRLTITSAGLVGIGTSNWDLNSVNTKMGVRLSGTTGDGISLLSQQNVANQYVAVGAQYDNTNTNNGSQIRFGIDSAGDTFSMIAFATANGGAPSEKMRLDRLGRLGIGTTPVNTLDVNGTARIRLSGNNLVVTTEGGAPYLQSEQNVPLHFGTNSQLRATLDASGRFLVGTSSARTIEPYGLGTDGQIANTYESVSDTNPGPGLALCSNSTTARMGPYLYLCRSGAATVGSNTLVSSGDNLGTISFAGADGTDVRTRGAAIYCEVDGTPGANDMPGRLVFSTTADGASSPTERMRIHSAGGLSVSRGIVLGNASVAPGDNILFGSAVIASGAGNSTLKFNTSSGLVSYDTSSRLVKEDIVDCPYGIDQVKQLRPRKYFRTDDQKEEIGFVADEMVHVMPEFVPTGAKSIITKNDVDTEEIPLGVNYEKLTAVLTKALQEVIAKIETLEAKVAALESA